MSSTDPYWTEVRRADPRALPFEPYRGHRVVERTIDGGRLYWIAEHKKDWKTPIEARAAIDRCVAEGECLVGRAERGATEETFARFIR